MKIDSILYRDKTGKSLVSKAKSSLQKILNIFALLVKNKQLRKLGGWAFSLLVFAILCIVNWKLFLATSVGIGLMSSCYVVQNSHWQRYCQKWQKFLSGPNRQLLIAVGSGAMGAFCTYLAASIWADAENQWLVVGAIFQGLASLTTVVLLIWSLWGKKAHSLENKLDYLIADLNHSSSLKRLVAIRQLTRLVNNNHLSPEYCWQMIEYYHLMLSEPQVLIVRNALLESLNLLGGARVLKKERTSVKIPLKLQKVEINSPCPEKHLL